MGKGRFDNPVEAALAGLKDRLRKQDLEGALQDHHRLDGKTAVVTGANSGIGFATAVQLAERGARVLMACRSGFPVAGLKVKAESGSSDVEMVRLDLSSPQSIRDFVDELEEKGEQVDVLVCNAGVAPPRARQTKDGLDEMFMVNYLANVLLIHALLERGLIPNDTLADNGLDEDRPRILFNSSDSHQGAQAIDFEELGVYEDYGVRGSIANYSYFKLVLNTYGVELSRRLTRDDGTPDVGVHCVCPGPVNTNIARDAPPWLMVVLKSIFTVFFQKPSKAARALTYLSASPDVDGETGLYLHMLNRKKMDPKCYQEAAGKALWERSMKLWSDLEDEPIHIPVRN